MMQEWWKRPEFSQFFNENGSQVATSPAPVSSANQPAPAASSLKPMGWSQQVGATNNQARSSIGGGQQNAAIDRQNKMVSAIGKNGGYTGAGPDNQIQPMKRVATADAHEGEFVLNADATQAIGPDVLQGLQSKAESGTLNVNSLRQVVGQPTKPGYQSGGLVTATPTMTAVGAGRAAAAQKIQNKSNAVQAISDVTGMGTKDVLGSINNLQQQGVTPTQQSSYFRSIGMSPEERATANKRADQMWQYNVTGMDKLSGVATGTDAMYERQKNSLMQDIGGAGAASTAAARQQAAQAGYSPSQLQSIGIQQQRAVTAEQGGKLADLATAQDKQALTAAEALTNDAFQQQQYLEGAESRKVALDAAVTELDAARQTKVGTDFLNAVTKLRNAGKTNAEIMSDPSVIAAWNQYAPSVGYDPSDLSGFSTSVGVAGMSETDVLINNLKQNGVTLTPAAESSLREISLLGGNLVYNSDGSIDLNVGGTITNLVPASTSTSTNVIDMTPAQTASYLGSTGNAKTFFSQPDSDNKYAVKIRGLVADGSMSKDTANTVGSELYTWTADDTTRDAATWRTLSADTQNFLKDNFPAMVPEGISTGQSSVVTGMTRSQIGEGIQNGSIGIGNAYDIIGQSLSKNPDAEGNPIMDLRTKNKILKLVGNVILYTDEAGNTYPAMVESVSRRNNGQGKEEDTTHFSYFDPDTGVWTSAALSPDQLGRLGISGS